MSDFSALRSFDALWEHAVPRGSRALPRASFSLSAASEFSYIVICAVEVVVA